MPAELLDDDDQLTEKLERVLTEIFRRFDKVRAGRRGGRDTMVLCGLRELYNMYSAEKSSHPSTSMTRATWFSVASCSCTTCRQPTMSMRRGRTCGNTGTTTTSSSSKRDSPTMGYED
ncbi:hypothetical protein BC938DRAFT_472205 [Jimgerdemannia flammicorona]|uniref:Uncharacterized protein n=1 Tax=Jimgerdemannia flammicorona TaxID=994334 RepID=A0A433QU63_9FUNG|nr:hypothetical protein BC938DRAFT_472205 [Jimgerdemannia flammicorona]